MASRNLCSNGAMVGTSRGNSVDGMEGQDTQSLICFDDTFFSPVSFLVGELVRNYLFLKTVAERVTLSFRKNT